MNPIVSVVIPCLNRAHFLIPTIESVLQQNYPNIECIVVDGGSTDATVEILKRYEKRLRWVSEPDRGHADAINKGWKMSSGEVLAWLNADDVWEIPKSVDTAVSYLDQHPEVSLVYGDCGEIDMEGNIVGKSHLHEWDLNYAVEFCDYCIPQPAAFMRRSIIEKVGWLDPSFISKKDHELWMRVGLYGTIHHLPVRLASARNQPGYLAKRGDITAGACVALTKKFFSLKDVPPELRSKRKRALSSAYTRGAQYAWIDGRRWPTVFWYSFMAILEDWTNRWQSINQLDSYLHQSASEHPIFKVLRYFLKWPLRTWALRHKLRE